MKNYQRQTFQKQTGKAFSCQIKVRVLNVLETKCTVGCKIAAFRIKGKLKHEPWYVTTETGARLTVLFLWRNAINLRQTNLSKKNRRGILLPNKSLGSIGKLITRRGNSTLNCTRKECDIGFQVQFDVELTSQVMDFP